MVLHCDEDDLALIAIGEPASPDDDAHLKQCARCRSRLDQLTAVVSSARTVTADDHPVMPPAEVWTAITSELGIADGSNVTPLSAATGRRRGRTWAIAGVAAAVGLVIGGLATGLVLSPGTGAEVLASASLDPIENSTFTGTATVEQVDGHAVLRVEVPGLPNVEDGYYEVWMATPDTSTMVAIGTMNPGEAATFDLPSGMDMTDFPIVDVSVEHFDGNTGHSAVSVVRGQLQA
jgi:hypothetical protein